MGRHAPPAVRGVAVGTPEGVPPLLGLRTGVKDVRQGGWAGFQVRPTVCPWAVVVENDHGTIAKSTGPWHSDAKLQEAQNGTLGDTSSSHLGEGGIVYLHPRTL